MKVFVYLASALVVFFHTTYTADDLYISDGIDGSVYTGRTDLHKAVIQSDFRKIDQLIGSGVDINKPDHFGWTALHCAVAWENIIALDKLIDAGVYLDAKSKRGETPLHMAVSLSDRFVERLLKAGAHTEIRDEDGNTPLHVAAIWGWPDAAKLLLLYGADVHSKNNEGLTPANIAADREFSAFEPGRGEVEKVFEAWKHNHPGVVNYLWSFVPAWLGGK